MWGRNQQIRDQLQIDTFWQRGFTGLNIKVGHLDTGLDPRHPSLHHQPFAFQHFDRYGFATGGLKPFDSAHHGTGIASIICGRLANGHSLGIAPDCKLYSGVVLEHGDIISRILFGMAWMLERAVQVLCIPLGILGYTPVFTAMTHLFHQRGTLVVAPIGNLGEERSLSPGNYQDVLSVGAVDAEGTVAKFSGSYHPNDEQIYMKPDILAPGTDIWVAKPGGGYHRVSGTSVACALTTGIVALLMQAAPSAPPTLIKQALINTSLPLPVNKQHRSRGGLVQAVAALEYVLPQHPDVSTETVRTTTLPNSIPHMDKYIDPRLQKLMQDSHEEYPIEAVFSFTNDYVAADDRNPLGATGAAIEHAIQISGHKPLRLRYIAAANLVTVFAKTAYLRALLNDPRLHLASAVDIDRIRLL